MELMQAHHQWATRPDDERFTSLTAMLTMMGGARENSRDWTIASSQLRALPAPSDRANSPLSMDIKGLLLEGPRGEPFAPTHWAFGQLVQLAEGRADYLRRLPSPIVADCINYGLQFLRAKEDVKLLLYKNGGPAQMRAATGPEYGRIWNVDIVRALVSKFGDGVSGDTFRVPGVLGQQVTVTKENTTLFASDRDMFVFLADEKHRVDIPNRRDGKPGALARGFFVWNSEVGSKSFGIATFLFDYVCANRIVWGAAEYKEIRMRHSSGAPDRFINEITPALETYASSSTASITHAVQEAQKKKIGDDEAVHDFLSKRFGFGKNNIAAIQATHELEEGRPIETIWDASTAVTAWARTIQHTDKRVEVERTGGAILDAAIK